MDFGIIEKFIFPEMTGWLLALKIFLVLFDLGAIAFIIYVWATTIYLRRLFIWDLIEFFTYRAYNVRVIDKDWKKIKKRLLTGKEAEYKMAVIEADILVDDVLTRSNYAGKNLAEKLEIRPDAFSDIAAMKEADQTYQNLVYDPSYSLDYQRAKGTILAFEQGLKDVSAFLEK